MILITNVKLLVILGKIYYYDNFYLCVLSFMQFCQKFKNLKRLFKIKDSTSKVVNRNWKYKDFSDSDLQKVSKFKSRE